MRKIFFSDRINLLGAWPLYLIAGVGYNRIENEKRVIRFL